MVSFLVASALARGEGGGGEKGGKGGRRGGRGGEIRVCSQASFLDINY